MTIQLYHLTLFTTVLFAIICCILAIRLKNNSKELIEVISLNDSLLDKNHFLTEQLNKKEEEFTNIQSSLKNEFKVLAQSILDHNSSSLSEQSKKTLSEVVLPLNENIHLFKSRLEELNTERVKDSSRLQVELENFKNLNSQMLGETNALTTALKGDKKAQGNWGEISLKKLLENSGLVEGREYNYQSVGMNLRDADGNLQLPDVAVMLPDDKYLIIDSKVSLVDYLGYINGESKEEQIDYKNRLFDSIKKHIDGLSNKSYESISKLNSPDFVFMFFPLEGALSLIADEKVKGHPGLSFIEYAWNKRVVICTPTSLFSNLKTVSILWSYAKQEKNQQEVYDLAAKVYDRFSDLTKNILSAKQKVLKSQKEVEDSLNTALTHGQTIGVTLEKIKDKGVGHKVKKQIPTELYDESIS